MSMGYRGSAHKGSQEVLKAPPLGSGTEAQLQTHFLA